MCNCKGWIFVLPYSNKSQVVSPRANVRYDILTKKYIKWTDRGVAAISVNSGELMPACRRRKKNHQTLERGHAPTSFCASVALPKPRRRCGDSRCLSARIMIAVVQALTMMKRKQGAAEVILDVDSKISMW